MNHQVHSFVINGFPIEVADSPDSMSALIIGWELEGDCYGLNRIDFKPGDVVIDIGAHIGMFAIYTALRFPQVVIQAASDLGLSSTIQTIKNRVNFRWTGPLRPL